MAELIFRIDFPTLNAQELSAVYDQTDTIKKAIEKALNKLPLGRYNMGVSAEVER